ncbi:hypothetical protein VTN02DRAFT_4280 [Thermoascus thermophilus]
MTGQPLSYPVLFHTLSTMAACDRPKPCALTLAPAPLRSSFPAATDSNRVAYRAYVRCVALCLVSSPAVLRSAAPFKPPSAYPVSPEVSPARLAVSFCNPARAWYRLPSASVTDRDLVGDVLDGRGVIAFALRSTDRRVALGGVINPGLHSIYFACHRVLLCFGSQK